MVAEFIVKSAEDASLLATVMAEKIPEAFSLQQRIRVLNELKSTIIAGLVAQTEMGEGAAEIIASIAGAQFAMLVKMRRGSPAKVKKGSRRWWRGLFSRSFSMAWGA